MCQQLLRSNSLHGIFIAAIGLVIVAPALAADYIVASAGQPTGDGSEASPWDLATALAAGKIIAPGDTIWLTKGEYRGGFKCELQGELEKPITIRSRPHHRVAIDCRPRDDRDDGLFYLLGRDLTVRDLEITCSDPKRVTQEKGPWPADMRRGGVYIRGDRCRMINCIVHDTQNGIGFWGDGEGGEISACLIYHNGWNAPDRAHGHAIYAQNKTGIKRITDNIIFRQFSHGVHCYGSDKASLKGLHVIGNFALFNGSLSPSHEQAPGVFVGGGSPLSNIVIEDNCLSGRLQVGYPWGVTGEEARVVRNYVFGDIFICDMHRLTLTDNDLIGEETILRLDFPHELKNSQFEWNRNRYVRDGMKWNPFVWVDVKKVLTGDFDAWKAATQFDADSDYRQGQPTGTHVVVRPNPHEAGRGHIFVANWSGTTSVDVDLSAVLQPGERFRILAAADYFGQPVWEGTYSGKEISLPMTPRKFPLPVGLSDKDVPEWDGRFGVWVVEAVE